MEREKFEESLKKAFEKAETTPSENVWVNIELDLERAKGRKLRRRVFFYQMVAAASVVFAMAIGGVGFFNVMSPQNSAGTLASRESDGIEKNLDEESSSVSPDEEGQISIENGEESSNAGSLETKDYQTGSQSVNGVSTNTGIDRSKQPIDVNKNGDTTADPSSQFDGSEAPPDADRLIAELHNADLPAFYSPSPVTLKIDRKTNDVDPVVAMLARLDQREREIRDEDNKRDKSKSDENLWTSIGFAAGSFNSLQSTAAPSSRVSSMSLAAPIVDQETKASGYSYSVGVNLGTKLSDRWVLQGGLNYMTQLSEYTANNVVMTSNKFQPQRYYAASTNELVNADEAELNSKLVYSAPYNVNNSMRYLSIPLQAGYMVVDKTFGLQLNAGVATDLFLRNTIEPQTSQLEKTTQSGGSDSPYRSVNLSGLVGTEFSYRIGDNYRVSLNPALRYPFNTIYKAELGVRVIPMTFDVGLKFRYIFK